MAHGVVGRWKSYESRCNKLLHSKTRMSTINSVCNKQARFVCHGVSEYSRPKLTPDQERLFAAEVDKWVDESWLVPHDEDVYGPL